MAYDEFEFEFLTLAECQEKMRCYGELLDALAANQSYTASGRSVARVSLTDARDTFRALKAQEARLLGKAAPTQWQASFRDQ